MIARLWHGWTSPGNADQYERLLREDVFPSIMARGIAGLHGISLLRRENGNEVEFVTVMRFSSMDDVVAFAGTDPSKAYVPPAARALLSHFDARSAHFEIRTEVSQ